LLRNGGYGATAGGNGNCVFSVLCCLVRLSHSIKEPAAAAAAATEFSRKQRNSYGAYVILTEFT